MMDCPEQTGTDSSDKRIDEIIETLRASLQALDELGLQIAAAHLSMAIEVLVKGEK